MRKRRKTILLICALFYCSFCCAQQNPLLKRDVKRQLSVWERSICLSWLMCTDKYYTTKSKPHANNKFNLIFSFFFPYQQLTSAEFRYNKVLNSAKLIRSFVLADSISFCDSATIELFTMDTTFITGNTAPFGQYKLNYKDKDSYSDRLETLILCSKFECKHTTNEKEERFDLKFNDEYSDKLLMIEYSDHLTFIYHKYVYPFRKQKINQLTVNFFDKGAVYRGRLVYDAESLNRKFYATE